MRELFQVGRRIPLRRLSGDEVARKGDQCGGEKPRKKNRREDEIVHRRKIGQRGRMPPKLALRDSQTLEAALDAIDAAKSVAEAARLVGVSSVTLLRIVSTPEFQAALQARVRARLAIDAVEALEYLGKVVKDPAQSTANRVNAARMIAERAGYVPPKAGEQAKNATSPAEMTSDQLRRQVEEIERELSQRAEPVRVESVQLTDMLD